MTGGIVPISDRLAILSNDLVATARLQWVPVHDRQRMKALDILSATKLGPWSQERGGDRIGRSIHAAAARPVASPHHDCR
jgi:hypothetical protein